MTGEAAKTAIVGKSQGSKRRKRKNEQRTIKTIYRESESNSESAKKVLLLGNSNIR